MLFLFAGVVRTREFAYGSHPFCAAGSAGGRFPLELYPVVPERSPGRPDGSSLPAGTHCYDPLEHSLVRVGPAPGEGQLALVVTGIPRRTGWRYRERGYRHVYWDAGTMLSQFIALAGSAGLRPRLYTRFPDVKVARRVRADRVHERPELGPA